MESLIRNKCHSRKQASLSAVIMEFWGGGEKNQNQKQAPPKNQPKLIS